MNKLLFSTLLAVFSFTLPINSQVNVVDVISSPTIDNLFGSDMETVGNNIVVGAPAENNWSGAVYFFDGSNLVQTNKITGQPRNIGFNSAFGLVIEFHDNNTVNFSISEEYRVYFYDLFSNLSGTTTYEWVKPLDETNMIAGNYNKVGAVISNNGFMVAEFDSMGTSGCSIGDINNDGTTDFVLSRSSYWGSNRGHLKAYSGADFTVIWEDTGDAQNEAYGFICESIEDINNDGVSDLVVSAPYARDNGLFAGFVQAVSGIDGAPLWKSLGVAGSEFGRKMEVANDLNGDNFNDVLVVAPKENGGTVYVLSGTDGSFLGSISGMSVLANVSGFTNGQFLISNPMLQIAGVYVGEVYICELGSVVGDPGSPGVGDPDSPSKNKGRGKSKKK